MKRQEKTAGGGGAGMKSYFYMGVVDIYTRIGKLVVVIFNQLI